MRQSLVTSLTSVYKQLHFGQMYLQFHQSLSSKREPKSLKSLQIVNLLIGLMTIGAVMHLSIESESYLNYLNSNQYLLNLRSQLGSPIFNAQGSVTHNFSVSSPPGHAPIPYLPAPRSHLTIALQ